MNLLTIEERFLKEMNDREAQAEKFACLLWFSVIILTYLLLLLDTDLNEDLRRNISYLVAVTAPSFLLIYTLINSGRYHPGLAYTNTLLQLTVVSGAIYFDTMSYGTQYALSSMPPLAYGLVIIVTAFRLRPFMGVFAGGLAAAQFLGLYYWVGRNAPDMSESLLSDVPSLGWEVTIMKVVILLGLGVAGSYSARSLRNELYNFMSTAQDEMRLHQSLGRYVSSQVADALRSDDRYSLATRKQDVAVMFGDIRNFTKFSNEHNPDEVANMLNQFFNHVDSKVTKHSGVLNKFLGDGFMAIFGLFDLEEDPRLAAVKCGQEIIEKTFPELDRKNMGVGIALNFGEVIAGEIGSEGRCEYTVLGNTVNVAARLEGLNRKLGSKLLITRDYAEALTRENFQMISRGEFDIRGIKDSIELVEILTSQHPEASAIDNRAEE